MKQLKEMVQAQGKIKSTSILDVSDFLNMQVDPKLMDAMGQAFSKAFEAVDFDAYITVEASGIAPAVFASLYSDKPLVIIKKQRKLVDNLLQQPCYSYTKKEDYYLSVNQKYIEGKRVILIDDFLASGSVVLNVDALCTLANAKLVHTGICISKDFQDGMQALKEKGYPVVSLARIKKMDPETGSIVFID